MTDEIGDFVACGFLTSWLVIGFVIIDGADVAEVREMILVLIGEFVPNFDGTLIGIIAVVGCDGMPRNWQAANGGAGHVYSTTGNESFGASLKAVEGNSHCAGFLRLHREKSSAGESQSREKRN